MKGSTDNKRARDDEDAVDQGYFFTYSRVGIHEDMIKDECRTRTYRDAIMGNKDLFADAVVVDVGCGTGILAMMAVLAGARHVYALEMSEIAEEAVKIIAANGMSDRITVFKGMAERQTLPEKADIIISEWMGYFLLYEWMLETVIAVRDRWLKPQGVMFPDKASISIALLTNEPFYEDRISFWSQRLPLLCNLDMSSLTEFAKRCNFSEPTVEYVQTENILSFAKQVVQLDLRQCTLQEIHNVSVHCTLESLGAGTLSGIVGWFDVSFPGGLVLSTSPETQEAQDGYNTHWRQCQFYLDKGHPVLQGDKVAISLTMGKSEKNRRFVEYALEMAINGVAIPRQQYLLA